MVLRGYESKDTYSQLEIRKAMNDYVQEEKRRILKQLMLYQKMKKNKMEDCFMLLDV